ncbi:sensor histidine kinase [Clostridium hydrogenum]|uniref:sensor histidine kinase n=1 Tax=Clostridium hydrogenum TaxID=2855764 RepID=UPI001F32B8DD|nr:sensor histidine kinase [Clostridium hydrogenum]
MKRVNYILKLIFLIYTFYNMVSSNKVYFEEILVLLVIIAINIYKEKYNASIYTVAVSFIWICIGCYINKNFEMLLPVAALDFIVIKNLIGMVCVSVVETYFLYIGQDIVKIIFLTCVCSMFAYVIRETKKKEINLKKSLDKERRLRYELEGVKVKLLNSSKEVVHIAEVSERNRIAREIHDSVGHKTAGVLIELQAAYKLMDRNPLKAKEVLAKSIDALSETVTIIRDTVHNIKPNEKLGIEYIKNIIRNFSFCPVELKFTGDFNSVKPNYIEIMASNIKEALTNTAKYSRASKVDISIDINELYLRLYIKNNGVSCNNIKEGLGLSGMRERVNNVGGSITIDSHDGFTIVCVIPFSGGEIFEGTNSR